MTLTPGTRLGPYEVSAQIGVGGMGEVYKATDTNLKRSVAIKIVPTSLAADPDRLARFQREAEVLAALNHPNIAAIYGLEKSDGTIALVMELVEGSTLADRIAQGAIPIDEALPIAKQIAEALEAAHEQGIIHRDLKPANIKVRADGTVKVLDFGLAKALKPTGAMAVSNSMSPTITTPAMTQAGLILGTAAYMSPEQARGRDADKRSDMWAFGCVLYEMLTGTRAFGGEDVSETLAAVIKSEPDWRLLPDNTPPSLRRVLRRCLTRDRNRRLADASTVRLEIEEAHDEPAGDRDVTQRASRLRERIAWISMLVVLTTIAAVIELRAIRSVPPAAAMRLEITTPSTTDPISLAISPDGQSVVFEARSENRSQLWLRSLDGLQARPIAGTENGMYPFWSPDGRSLGFYADGKLKRINLDGGAVQTLANAPEGRGGAWSDDGSILFSASVVSPIVRIPATGGEPAAVTQLKAAQFHGFPQWLPDRRHFLFYVQSTPDSRGVYVGDIDDAANGRRLVDADSTAVYASSGQLLFVRQGTLFAQDFDPVRLRLTGDAYSVAEQVAVGEAGSSGSVALSASQTGSVVYRSSLRRERQLVWVDRRGNEIEKVAASTTAVLNPSMSPDGRRLAVQRTVNANIDIWLLEVSRGVFSRFTSDAATDANPLWSPDETRIIFTSNRNGRLDIYQKSVVGAGDEVPLISTQQAKTGMDWSSDGRFVLYRVTDPKLGFDIWAAPMTGDRKPFPVVQTQFDERDAQFSPDGEWIAYQSNESGAFEIYVQPFPGPGMRERISTNGGAQVRWRRDGKEIFYIALDGRLMAVPIRLAPDTQTVEVGTPLPLFTARIGSPVPELDRQEYIVAADGQRFLLNAVTEEPGASPITILLNWRPRR